MLFMALTDLQEMQLKRTIRTHLESIEAALVVPMPDDNTLLEKQKSTCQSGLDSINWLIEHAGAKTKSGKLTDEAQFIRSYLTKSELNLIPEYNDTRGPDDTTILSKLSSYPNIYAEAKHPEKFSLGTLTSLHAPLKSKSEIPLYVPKPVEMDIQPPSTAEYVDSLYRDMRGILSSIDFLLESSKEKDADLGQISKDMRTYGQQLRNMVKTLDSNKEAKAAFEDIKGRGIFVAFAFGGEARPSGEGLLADVRSTSTEQNISSLINGMNLNVGFRTLNKMTGG